MACSTRICWLLIPSRDIIEAIAARHTKLQDKDTMSLHPIDEVSIGAKTFEYRLIPLVEWITNIYRLVRLDLVSTTSAAELENPCHKYPFAMLLVLKSHVQSPVVIYGAGQMLSGIYRMPLVGAAATILGIGEDSDHFKDSLIEH
ncbi:hypothetical protein EW146_g9022 [Bondarzewia mesenterica]|uniref:Uncharacterized protein n=1 Tax=Bondarzewia mesenterica TaxID=1095465 RepID=A0A4S4LB74_9AGAM|nr:hypothetical protein EW146_g9022 [Bondarzewia mesenterica]